MKYKTITEFPEYEVSQAGSVRKKKTGRVLKASINKSGYLYVTLKGKQRRIHRLIALEFLPNDYPKTRTTINHKNGIKLDNSLENLEWVTLGENTTHSLYTLGNIKRVKEDRQGTGGGVYAFPYGKKNYRAVISKSEANKSRTLGYFKTEAEAVEAYVKEHIKVFGFIPYQYQEVV